MTATSPAPPTRGPASEAYRPGRGEPSVNEQVRAQEAVKTDLMAWSSGVRARSAWRRIVLSAVVLAAGTAGLGLGTAGSATAASKTLEGVPRLSHVFVIVLENEDYNSTWGPNSPAKYLNSLVPHGALATHYYGVS